VATQGIGTHWIRRTILTWIERNFGYAVAHAYGGRTHGGEADATAPCVRASLAEVAAALAALTGEPHPIAMTEGGVACTISAELIGVQAAGEVPRRQADCRPAGTASRRRRCARNRGVGAARSSGRYRA
jgi:hypothetical protein